MKHRTALAIGIAVLASQAQAQTINYGEMEELFGEPITTSATGSPQRRSEVPVTMDIVTAEDIRRAGTSSIPDILSRLAGVDVYHWSNNMSDVSIRGLNQGSSNRLMVMINGRENYTDGLGTVLWDLLPVRIEEIRQIEVIKGPNSALYGFNASGGVINIITFNPEYDKVNAERVTIGSDGTEEGSAVQTGHWTNGGIRASAGWTKYPENQFHPAFNGDQEAAINPSITRNVNFDTQFELGERTQLRLQGALADGDVRGMYVMPFVLKSNLSMTQANLSTESQLGMIEASLMNNHYQISEFENTLASGKFTNNVTVAKLQDLFKVGPLDTFRLGTEYRRDTLPTFPMEGGDLLSQNGALSGMWDHAFSNQWSLLNAVRGDRFWLERSGPFLPGTPYTNDDYKRAIYGWSFNSAAIYHPTQLDSLKVSAARGLQLPSLAEFAVMNPLSTQPFFPPFSTLQVNSIGNPNLNPTRTQHYELSYDRDFPQAASSGRLAAYHQVVTGIRDFTPLETTSAVPPTLVMSSSYGPSGGAHLNGLEAELKGRIDQAWHWGANYSYEVVTDDTAVNQYHNYSRSTPRHKANATLGWEEGPWELDSRVRYVASTELPQQVSFGTFSLFPVAPVWAFSQRVAYKVNPDLRFEANATSGFNDNPVASEKRRILFSVIAKY